MGRPSEQGKETEEKLHQQFQHLQQQWDSIKHLKPRTLCRSSTDSRVMFKELHLLNNSPRNLMSSLQHRRSPLDGGGAWKVRYNDLAVEEILRDRKAAIESGKLKGRRLFEEEEEGASEVGSGEKQDIISDNWNGFEEMSMFSYNSDEEKENVESKEEELYPVLCHYGSCSYSSSTSYICDDCIDEAVATEKKGVNIVAGYSNRLTKAKGWLAIILILCAICIISMQRLSGNGKVKEVILVPT